MVNKHTEYSIQNHFPDGYENSKILYEIFQARLLELDSRIQADPKKKYIGFKIGSKVVVAVSTLQSKIKIHLYRVEPIDLIDSDNKVKYKTNSFEDYNKHVSYYDVNGLDDIEYALNLTNQVINKFFDPSKGGDRD